MSHLVTETTTSFTDRLPDSADELEVVLSEERQQLKRSLDELGSAVREKVNVRSQLREHPMVAVGAAFAGGVMLGALSKKGMPREGRNGSAPRRPDAEALRSRSNVGSTFAHMASTIAALVGQRLAGVAEDTVRNALARHRDRT